MKKIIIVTIALATIGVAVKAIDKSNKKVWVDNQDILTFKRFDKTKQESLIGMNETLKLMKRKYVGHEFTRDFLMVITESFSPLDI